MTLKKRNKKKTHYYFAVLLKHQLDFIFRINVQKYPTAKTQTELVMFMAASVLLY